MSEQNSFVNPMEQLKDKFDKEIETLIDRELIAKLEPIINQQRQQVNPQVDQQPTQSSMGRPTTSTDNMARSINSTDQQRSSQRNNQGVIKSPKWKGIRGLWRSIWKGNSFDNPDYLNNLRLNNQLPWQNRKNENLITLEEYSHLKECANMFFEDNFDFQHLNENMSLAGPIIANFKQELVKTLRDQYTRITKFLKDQDNNTEQPSHPVSASMPPASTTTSRSQDVEIEDDDDDDDEIKGIERELGIDPNINDYLDDEEDDDDEDTTPTVRNQTSDAEDKARKDAEDKARKDAEDKARKDAEDKARKDAEDKARKDAEDKARKDAEDKARKDAEDKARKDAEDKARKDAEPDELDDIEDDIEDDIDLSNVSIEDLIDRLPERHKLTGQNSYQDLKQKLKNNNMSQDEFDQELDDLKNTFSNLAPSKKSTKKDYTDTFEDF